MQKLFAKGADINGRDEMETTPLMAAAAEGQVAAMDLLLSKGADVNAKTEVEFLRGYTALIAAVMGGRTEAAKMLIAKGADINPKFLGRWSPLVIASSEGQTEIAELLLKKGADSTNLERDVAELKKEAGESRLKAQRDSFKSELMRVYTSARLYLLDHPGSIITKQAQLAEAGWTSIPEDVVFVRADLTETSGGIVLRHKNLDEANSIAAKDLRAGEGMVNFAGELYLPSVK